MTTSENQQAVVYCRTAMTMSDKARAALVERSALRARSRNAKAIRFKRFSMTPIQEAN